MTGVCGDRAAQGGWRQWPAPLARAVGRESRGLARHETGRGQGRSEKVDPAPEVEGETPGQVPTHRPDGPAPWQRVQEVGNEQRRDGKTIGAGGESRAEGECGAEGDLVRCAPLPAREQGEQGAVVDMEVNTESGGNPHRVRSLVRRDSMQVVYSIDENYRVIALILESMVIYPSVWRIMHYSRYARFL